MNTQHITGITSFQNQMVNVNFVNDDLYEAFGIEDGATYTLKAVSDSAIVLTNDTTAILLPWSVGFGLTLASGAGSNLKQGAA